MNSGMKTFLLWMAVILGGYLFIQMSQKFKSTSVKVDFSEFQRDLKEGRVNKVSISGSTVMGERKDAAGLVTKFSTTGPLALDTEFIKELEAAKVSEYKFEPQDDGRFWILLSNWAPLILVVVLFFFFMRNLQSGGGKALSFGKSRAKLLRDDERGRITFKDVAGLPEAKQELEEIVEFLRDPKKYQKLGGRIPKGVLLMGAPGTGKNLIPKAIAGEANVPFFTIRGGDFVETFVGVGASRVRDLFVQARKAAPCLIFIDEIDAVGRQRGAGVGGGHDEREQTLNQLLVEMDGFEGKEGIITIAATNRPDVLDPALLRPGRFDRRVVVPKPDLKGREEILKVHAAKLKLADDINLSVIARSTPGLVGADLENLCNEAALFAARGGKESVTTSDFEEAKDKIMMGTERKSMILSKKEKETTAIHEAGHALVARMLPGTDPVYKVTIIPRGLALGLTMQLPEDDRYNLTEREAHNQIAILMGGRVAEEIVNTDVTTGASNDIERATELARKMVTEWGMSEKVGPIHYSSREEHVFLGREMNKTSDVSERMAMLIDEEVKTIVMSNYNRAKQILRENFEKLKKITDLLCEKETIDAADLDRIIFEVDGSPSSLIKSAS